METQAHIVDFAGSVALDRIRMCLQVDVNISPEFVVFSHPDVDDNEVVHGTESIHIERYENVFNRSIDSSYSLAFSSPCTAHGISEQLWQLSRLER